MGHGGRLGKTKQRNEVLGAKGDISEKAGYMASTFCEFDLFTANTQYAIYEEYTKHKKFFPPVTIALRGSEYEVSIR